MNGYVFEEGVTKFLNGEISKNEITLMDVSIVDWSKHYLV